MAHFFCCASILLISAISALAATDTDANKNPAGYKSVWKGGLDSGECYYLASRALNGNFASGAGEELALLDDAGFGHVLKWNGQGFSEVWITSDRIADQPVEKTAVADFAGDGSDSSALMLANGELNVWNGESDSFEMLCRDCASELRGQYRIRLIAASDFDGDRRDEIIAWAESKGHFYLLTLELSGDKLELFSSHQIEGAGKALDILVLKRTSGEEDYFLLETGGILGYRLTNLVVDEEGIRIGRRLPLNKQYKKIISAWAGKTSPKNKSAVFLLTSRGGQLDLIAIDPTSGKELTLIEKAPLQTRLALSADIYGDGKEEIIFTEVNCKYNIYSKAQTKAPGARNSKPVKQR
ncbi:MAG: hypothetical protein WCX65_00800 [bacterium]